MNDPIVTALGDIRRGFGDRSIVGTGPGQTIRKQVALATLAAIGATPSTYTASEDTLIAEVMVKLCLLSGHTPIPNSKF